MHLIISAYVTCTLLLLFILASTSPWIPKEVNLRDNTVYMYIVQKNNNEIIKN